MQEVYTAVMGGQLLYFMKKVVELSKIQSKLTYRVKQLEQDN